MVHQEIGIAPSHIPTIASGKYEMKTGMQNNLSPVPDQEIAFYVSGYTHTIPQNEILAVYPPVEHSGDFAGTFPHVQFRRSILPWEFDCRVQGERVPYVFLVLLKEDELASGAFEILETDTNHLKDSLEDTNDPKPLKILHALRDNHGILPPSELLSQLAHVRVQEHHELKDLHLPKETSVVIAHRMVEPATQYRALVCYYSVEVIIKEKGQYQLNNSGGKNEYLGTGTCVVLSEWSFESISAGLYQIDTGRLKNHPDFSSFQNDLEDSEVLSLEELKTMVNPELFKLISSNEAYLKAREERWNKLPEPRSADDFELTEEACSQEGNNFILEYLKYNGKNLKGYLYDLNLQPFKTKINLDHKAVNKLIDVAKVPLEHQLKAGGKIVSWYQGPFTNWNYSFGLREMPDGKGWEYIPDHQDYLNLFNDDTKMYDVTYAAAWQLGRLMIMNDHKVLQELKKWKNELEVYHLVQEQNRYSHLPNLATQPPVLPDLLTDYVAEMMKFRNFPVYYLLPHADLSSEESIKYFKIDNSWILAFLYGIFSAGPKLGIRDFEDYILNHKTLHAVFDYTKPYYGILLQSQAIKNWPHLVVELDGTADFHYITAINDTMRLYITGEKFSDIGIYLKNENAHFGRDYSPQAEKFIRPAGNSVKTANEYLFRQPKVAFKLSGR